MNIARAPDGWVAQAYVGFPTAVCYLQRVRDHQGVSLEVRADGISENLTQARKTAAYVPYITDGMIVC